MSIRTKQMINVTYKKMLKENIFVEYLSQLPIK